MKNRILTCLSLGLLTCISFTSCSGETRLSKIEENAAIKLAQEMLERQSATSFVLPDTFTYTCEYTTTYASKDDDGTISKNESTSIEYIFDLTNLKIKEYKKESTKESETYSYYDEQQKGIVYLKNINGKKTKSTSATSKEAAINVFKSERSNKVNEYELIKDFYLSNFETDLAEIRKDQALIKNESDQYINMYYGSNGDKSLQIIKDLKIYEKSKASSKVPSDIYYLKGYGTYKRNNIYANDMLESMNIEENTDLKCDELGYYFNSSNSEKVKCVYNKAEIKLPNANDYKSE